MANQVQESFSPAYETGRASACDGWVLHILSHLFFALSQVNTSICVKPVIFTGGRSLGRRASDIMHSLKRVPSRLAQELTRTSARCKDLDAVFPMMYVPKVYTVIIPHFTNAESVCTINFRCPNLTRSDITSADSRITLASCPLFHLFIYCYNTQDILAALHCT